MSDPEATARVWRNLRALVLDHDRRQAVSEALGMSFIRAKALRRLAHGPMSMRELAVRLSTDRPYTTLIVDDLESRGLVSRAVDPGDRRAKIVTITAAGRAAAERANQILDTPPEPLHALNGADLEALDRIVAALISRRASG